MKKPILDKWYTDKHINARIFEEEYPNGLFYRAMINKCEDEYRFEISLCKQYKEAYKYLIDGQLACNSLRIAKNLEQSIRNGLRYL